MRKLWDISNDNDRLHIKSHLLFARIVGAISLYQVSSFEMLHGASSYGYCKESYPLHQNIIIVM